jgi:predicted dehydrogenase
VAVPDLDVVVVASPSGRHVEHAEALLEAGIAVVVDKPIATDAHQAQGLVDLAAGRGVPLTVFQNRRYDPEFATIRDLLHRGVLGELRRTEMRWDRWRPVPKDPLARARHGGRGRRLTARSAHAPCSTRLSSCTGRWRRYMPSSQPGR